MLRITDPKVICISLFFFLFQCLSQFYALKSEYPGIDLIKEIIFFFVHALIEFQLFVFLLSQGFIRVQASWTYCVVRMAIVPSSAFKGLRGREGRYVFVFVYVHVHILVCKCAYMDVYGDWDVNVNTLLSWFPLYFWENVSTNLELIHSAWLANKLPGSVSASPALGLQMCIGTSDFLCGSWSSKLRSSCLY